MTIEASVAARPSIFEAPALFSWALIGATVLPFLTMAFAEIHPVGLPIVTFLMAVGGAHVLATSYLLSDPAIRRFCMANPIKMIVVPCLLLVTGVFMFSRLGPFFIVSLLAVFLWQAWHFGAQNIGVAAFVSLSDRGRPLAPLEKLVIKLGIWVGMLGVLKVMSPMIATDYAPLPAQVIEVLNVFYRIGAVLAVPVTGMAVWLALVAWRDKFPIYGLTIFLSVTFLLTMYMTNDYYLGFMAFVTAHGLQYIIFLFTHSFNQQAPKSPRRSIFLAPAVLLATMFLGHFVFENGPHLGLTNLPKLGAAMIISISLVHFWVDRFVWRMTNKERAGWMRNRFGPVIQVRRLGPVEADR